MDKLKILMVDDEPTNLKILRLRLQENYELCEASCGEEALLVAQQENPAIILLDIMMPGIDGYEVTRKLRENPLFQMTKIILVSGKSMMDDKLQGYRSGADDYITKPFYGEELKAKLSTFTKLYLLERRQQHEAA